MVVKAAASVVVVLLFLVVGILGPAGLARLRRRFADRADRVRRRHTRDLPAAPTGRPIERIAYDVHRLGHRYRCPPAGISFARFDARRRAYDAVLVEACTALEVEHLLAVLPAGTDLDTERERVEGALGLAGLRLGGAA